MKISFKIILLIFSIFLLTIIQFTSSKLTNKYENKCKYNIFDDDLECMNDEGLFIKRSKCNNIPHLLDKYDYPFFIHVENPLIYLNYSTNFFELYHSKNINSTKSIQVSEAVKDIAENIQKNYNFILLQDKSRFMLNELFNLELYNQKGVKYKIFKQQNVSGDELFCNAIINKHLIIPVVVIDDSRKVHRRAIALSNIMLNTDVNKQYSKINEVVFEHKLMYYGLKSKMYGTVKLFFEGDEDKQ